MAQSTDIVLSDQLGSPFRAELNQILSALGTDNSGNSEPLNTYQFMKWVDTSNATYYYIKERNHDDTAWVTLFRYTVATKIMEAVSGGVVLTDMTAQIHASSSKTTPVDADEIGLIDSASTFTLKKLTWANLKATLKTYFDTSYVALSGNQTIADIKTFTSFPITPSLAPTTDYQVANKKYVTDNAGISLVTANSYDLGVGQTWQDVKASRAIGTTYTNSTGKPIEVAITTTQTSSPTIVVNGISILTNADNVGGVIVGLSCIIPNGATYSLSNAGGTITYWFELR